MPARMTLTATVRRGFSWSASYTVPIPPDAMARLMRYCPIRLGTPAAAGDGACSCVWVGGDSEVSVRSFPFSSVVISPLSIPP